MIKAGCKAPFSDAPLKQVERVVDLEVLAGT
jgi:hypothetical protein